MTLRNYIIEKSLKKESIRKEADLLEQRKFVDVLVGPNYLDTDECKYIEATDEWEICGVRFKCFTEYSRSHYAVGRTLPCLAIWNGSTNYYPIYCVEDLAPYLKLESTK